MRHDGGSAKPHPRKPAARPPWPSQRPLPYARAARWWPACNAATPYPPPPADVCNILTEHAQTHWCQNLNRTQDIGSSITPAGSLAVWCLRCSRCRHRWSRLPRRRQARRRVQRHPHHRRRRRRRRCSSMFLSAGGMCEEWRICRSKEMGCDSTCRHGSQHESQS